MTALGWGPLHRHWNCLGDDIKHRTGHNVLTQKQVYQIRRMAIKKDIWLRFPETCNSNAWHITSSLRAGPRFKTKLFFTCFFPYHFFASNTIKRKKQSYFLTILPCVEGMFLVLCRRDVLFLRIHWRRGNVSSSERSNNPLFPGVFLFVYPFYGVRAGPCEKNNIFPSSDLGQRDQFSGSQIFGTP